LSQPLEQSNSMASSGPTVLSIDGYGNLEDTEEEEEIPVSHASTNKSILFRRGNSRVTLADFNSGIDEPVPSSMLNLTGQIEVLDNNGRINYGLEYDIEENAWGAFVVALIRNTAVIAQKQKSGLPIRVNIARAVLAMFTLLVNLMLQMLMLWYINLYLVEPAVRQIQLLYLDFYEAVLENAEDDLAERWEAYERKDDICGITMVNRPFYYSMVLLWVLTQAEEIRQVERLCRHVLTLPSAEGSMQMIDFANTKNFALEGKCHIGKLTVLIRILLLLSTVVPRLAISWVLLNLGCRWLSASKSATDIILNSLALGFVLTIDELLYGALLPVATRAQITETKIFFLHGNKPGSLRQVETREWQGYGRTLCYLLGSLLFLGFYVELWQSVLPENLFYIADLCADHNINMRAVVCESHAFADFSPCVKQFEERTLS